MNLVREIRNVLKHQASSLMEASANVGSDFVRAIRLIHSCRGNLVVTGVGKSGLIAQKIASTFASTGTPSIFLHPSEALHGNLGVVRKNDVVLAIGKSGESEEILAILPSLRKIGAKIIALTANPKSSLARQSSVVLYTPIKREACPLNLAPTTSSTVAMVVGDALAIALMKLRGFKAENFALYHPGGLLGKQLLLKVADVMRGGRRNPVVKVNASMERLLTEISRKWTGACSIVDGNGRFLGLVTDFDIRKMLLNKKSVMDLKIKEVMNPHSTTVRDVSMAIEAVRLMEMRKKPFTVLPVLDARRRAVGMIHIHDLMMLGLTSGPNA
jgi:arabinose-5-phosphate isomerase